MLKRTVIKLYYNLLYSFYKVVLYFSHEILNDMILYELNEINLHNN